MQYAVNFSSKKNFFSPWKNYFVLTIFVSRLQRPSKIKLGLPSKEECEEPEF